MSDDAPPPRDGSTKPVDYAPKPAPSPDVESSDALLPPPGPRGYVIEGFSPDRHSKRPDPATSVVMAPSPHETRIGDRAGEPLWMSRGERAAWGPVVLAFVLVGAGASAVASALLAWTGLAPWLGAPVGLALATAAFHDRWRCVEAFASRPRRARALTTPLAAAAYALRRGVMKLRGR